MFGGEWHGGGAGGAAVGRGGGIPIPRPSSASSLPDGRRYAFKRPASEGGKRPFASFEQEHVDVPEDAGVILTPRPKRPRYIDFALERTRAREPAFFILREAGQPQRPASAHGFRDDLHIDPVIMRMPSPVVSERVLDHGGGGSVIGIGIGAGIGTGSEVIAHRFLRTDLPKRAEPPPPATMERTSSGLSLAPEEDDGAGTTSNYSDMRKDEQAASRVERHFAQYHKRARDSKAERILKSLISPRSSPGREEFEIDNDALQSIFRAANEIFFHGCLKNRVRWDWSSEDDSAFSPGSSSKKIIGTTALRTAADGGYETLIVLSRRYLRDRRYNRRLLISTFLHELIHSYLFVRCGFKARRFGGHTAGFRRIARVIDDWAGPDTLFLSNMEADLDDFRTVGSPKTPPDGRVIRRDSAASPMTATTTTMMMLEDDGGGFGGDAFRNCCMQCAEDFNGPLLPLMQGPAVVSPTSPSPPAIYRPAPPALRFMDQRTYRFGPGEGGSPGFGPA